MTFYYKLIKSEDEIVLDDGGICSLRMLLYCPRAAEQPACHVLSYAGPATEMSITLAYFTSMLHIPQTALFEKRLIVLNMLDQDLVHRGLQKFPRVESLPRSLNADASRRPSTQSVRIWQSGVET